MKKIIFLFVLSLILPLTSTYSQERASQGERSVINTIAHVARFSQLFPQEKVYLHFDNTGYFMGETIWYKAYVVQTASEAVSAKPGVRSGYKPTGLSKVLYVELVNPSGDVLETQKLHVDENGGAHGQFLLDSILGTGFYEIRAYTRYMVNWGVSAMFSRVFPVFEKPVKYGDYSRPTIKTTLYKDRNPNSRMADSLYLTAAKDGIFTDDKPKKISAHFYPEGGDMVAGLQSRVAFLVTDDNGAAYRGKGRIVNESGKVIGEVETDSAGRGLFSVTPSGERLYLSMANPTDKIQRIALPEVRAEGMTMYLDVVSDDISVTLRSQGDILGKEIGYAIMQNGSIVACDTMTAAPLIELSLMRETMPYGVNQLTVFTEGGRILSERLFFICPQPDASDSITVTPVSKGLGPVSEVELTLHTVPNTNFSFSAMDYGALTGGKQGNARTWMLLSSDVKGYIADVDYYFEADDAQHRSDADLLMMIQGWRRYDWNLMCGNRWFENTQPIEDQLFLHGKLREYRKKNPVGNVEVDTYLFNHQGQSLHGTTKTDSLGNYLLNLPDISGDWSLQIFTKINDKRKTFYVGIDRQFAPTPRFITPDETRLTPRTSANLFSRDWKADEANEDTNPLNYAEKVRVIPEVTVKARKYWTSTDNIQWYSQRTGRHWASIYYDAPAELDKILDTGAEMPNVFEFLAMRNPLFGNPRREDLPHLLKSDFIRLLDPADDTGRTFKMFDCQTWEGGMAYGGRKIRWIIDNGLGEGMSDPSHFLYMDSVIMKEKARNGDDSFAGIVNFPVNMDELKAIYIVPWSPKEEESYVRIYLYRQQIFTTESQKGLRKTRFQGYNVPQTFSMEDTNVLPPLENLRRTLFWDPDVKADANGEARIMFYNNLSCREIFYSAEGLTPDGRIVIGE